MGEQNHNSGSVHETSNSQRSISKNSQRNSVEGTEMQNLSCSTTDRHQTSAQRWEVEPAGCVRALLSQHSLGPRLCRYSDGSTEHNHRQGLPSCTNTELVYRARPSSMLSFAWRSLIATAAVLIVRTLAGRHDMMIASQCLITGSLNCSTTYCLMGMVCCATFSSFSARAGHD